MSTQVSRSESAGRAGRRRARRSARRRRDEPVRDGTYTGDGYTEEDYDRAGEGYDGGYGDGGGYDSGRDDRGGSADDYGDDHSGGEELDSESAAGTPGRRAEKRRRKDGSRRSARRADPVSRFSASALRRVSVLGDRPSQMVNSLAEQSKRKRGTVILGVLLALCGVALLALLGLLASLLLAGGPISGGDKPELDLPEEGHSTLLPTVYQGATTELDVFDPIAERGADAAPLDDSKVFGGDAKELEQGDLTMALKGSETTDTCTQWVWGEDLGQSLVDGECTSAVRGVYTDSSDDYVGQVALFDMATADAASATAEILDPRNPDVQPGFLVPMDTSIEGLQTGYSQASTQAMGHYLAVYWVAPTDGSAPEADDTGLAEAGVLAMDASIWVYEQAVAAKGDD